MTHHTGAYLKVKTIDMTNHTCAYLKVKTIDMTDHTCHHNLASLLARTKVFDELKNLEQQNSLILCNCK